VYVSVGDGVGLYQMGVGRADRENMHNSISASIDHTDPVFA
jgi:hypothetical protein